jgi:hypothetical protein
MIKQLLMVLTGISVLGVTTMAAQAKEVAQPRDVAVTIYNEDLALIREVRPVELDEGSAVYRLPEVSGQLKPETVHLSFPDGAAFKLLEQNYDYDLVSVDKLLEKFIGRQLVLIDDETKTNIQVTLLSTSGGRVVRDNEGQILINPPGRVVLPPGSADELLLRPTLSWQLWSELSGRHDAEITYLSGGLSWQADYVVLLNADDTAGDIEGWVTVRNYSGTTYNDAHLKLVAGDVNVVRKNMQPPAPAMVEMRAATAAPAGFQEEQFFEYHLYDLPRATTIRNNQMKQIGLLTATGVPFEKLLIFDGINGGDTRVEMQFTNEEEAGMGMPLPKGTVRVFKQDSSGDAQFVGEDSIDHTPKDEDVRLYIGNAFDIVGETKRTEYTDLKKGYTASYEVTLKNHKENEDVKVTVPVVVRGDWRITQSNYDYEMKDASTAQFEIPVKADGEATLTFSFKVTWK